MRDSGSCDHSSNLCEATIYFNLKDFNTYGTYYYKDSGIIPIVEGKMNIKTLTGMLIVALAFAVVLVAIHPHVTDSGDDPSGNLTNREVVVFSDDNFVKKTKSILNDSTKNVDSFLKRTLGAEGIAVIDEPWYSSGGKNLLPNDYIKNLIDANTPVIFVNGDSYLYEKTNIKLRADVLTGGNVACCMYLTSEGTTLVQVFSGDDLDEVLVSAYDWADDVSPLAL